VRGRLGGSHAAVRVSAVRRRPARVHRQRLRDDGGAADPRNRRPALAVDVGARSGGRAGATGGRLMTDTIAHDTVPPTLLEVALRHDRVPAAMLVIALLLVCWTWIMVMARDLSGR